MTSPPHAVAVVAVVHGPRLLRGALVAALLDAGYTAADLGSGDTLLETDLRAVVCLAADPLRTVPPLVARAPATPVVAVLERANVDTVVAALAAGAHGAVGCDAPVQDLIEVLEAAAAGHVTTPHTTATAIARRALLGRAIVLDSHQEQWLRALGSGATNAEIAQRVSVDESEVSAHLRSLYRQLGLSGRTEAVLLGQSLAAPARAVRPQGRL